MHLSILLGLAASSVFAASAPDNEIVRRAPLVKRNLAATSLNSLYARQALTCDFGYGICPDGITCCPTTGGPCCLDGCCQFFYSCDPTGLGTRAEPCVCSGPGCPDPQEDDDDFDDDDDDFSSTSTRTTRTRSPSDFAPPTTSPTSTFDPGSLTPEIFSPTTTTDDDATTTATTTSITSTTTATDSDDDITATGTPSASDGAGSGVAGGSIGGGSDTGAAVQVSSIGIIAIMLLAGSIGVAAVVL